MGRSASVAFGLALAVLFAWSIVQAQGFRAQARLFPLIIAGVGLALALLQVGIELRHRRSGSQSQIVAEAHTVRSDDGQAPLSSVENVPPELQRRRTLAILGWIAGFTLAVWLLGFPIAVPVGTLAYLRFGAGEPWPLSAAFAAVFGLCFWALFVHLVRVPFDEGVLVFLWAG